MIAHNFNTKVQVDALKQRINQLKGDKANPPKLKRGKGCSIKEVNEFIGSMIAMISSIISTSVSDMSFYRVDREIKMFLSNTDKVQAFTTMP